jgi:hypothetical protein
MRHQRHRQLRAVAPEDHDPLRPRSPLPSLFDGIGLLCRRERQVNVVAPFSIRGRGLVTVEGRHSVSRSQPSAFSFVKSLRRCSPSTAPAATTCHDQPGWGYRLPASPAPRGSSSPSTPPAADLPPQPPTTDRHQPRFSSCSLSGAPTSLSHQGEITYAGAAQKLHRRRNQINVRLYNPAAARRFL